MKIFLSFFCLVTAFFAGLQAAEPALTISNSWRGVAGPGKVTAADGIIVTERAANASRAFIAIADAAADMLGSRLFGEEELHRLEQEFAASEALIPPSVRTG